MNLRSYNPSDLARLIDLTIKTFGPFYEESFRSIVGDTIYVHQHGTWREDYRQEVAKLHEPEQNKYVVVADDAGTVVGYAAWYTEPARRHGGIDILAVESGYRRRGVGRRLCEHAMTDMEDRGVEVVEVRTGGDAFHAPARALYESLGYARLPTAVYFKEL